MTHHPYRLLGLILTLCLWNFAVARAQSVDLAVINISPPVAPAISNSWNWSIVATNRGPSPATGVHLSCVLPTNTVLLQSASSLGAISLTGNVLHVSTPTLTAGDALQLSFTLRPTTGGWATNSFNLTANETDSDPTDNQAQFINFIGPSGTSNAVDTFRLSVKQLVVDQPRHRIYALERTTATNQTILYQMDGTTLQPQLLRTLPGVATHLRLTADGRFLYAVIQSGRTAQRIDLLQLEPDLVFETFNPPANRRYRFFDLKPDPTDSRRVITAASIETSSGTLYDTIVATFQEGIQQPQTVSFREYFSTPGNQAALEIDTNGIVILGTEAYPDRIVERLSLVPNGVQLINQYIYSGLSAGFVFLSNRIYARTGGELVADTGRTLRTLPSTQSIAGGINYLAENDRLLFTQNGPTLQVQVFDRPTFARTGIISLGSSITVDSTTVLEGPRLALTTTDGRLLLITHSLISGTAPADLVVKWNIQPPQPQLNQSVQITITVTNQGPSNAVSPAITFESPKDFSRTLTTPAAAPSTGAGNFPEPLLWTNTTLSPGQGRVFQIQGKFTAAGLMYLAAGAASQSIDPIRTNDRVELSVAVPYTLAPGQGARIATKALDALFDPIRNAILCIPTSDDPLAGQLVALNADSGIVLSNWTVGAFPSNLVLADDQHTLYVTTDNGATITKLELASMQVLNVFPVAPDTLPAAAVRALKLAVDPLTPDQIVARRSDGKLAIYSNAVFQSASSYVGGDFAFFAPHRLIAPNQSYPFPLNRYRIVGGTLQADGSGGPIQVTSFRTASGFMFADDGRFIDPLNLLQLGSFAAGGPAALDPDANIVYFPNSSSGIGLRAFDLPTQSPLKDETMGASFGQTAVDLFRAGTDLLVTRYSSGILIAMRTAAQPAPASADLTITVATNGPWKAALPCSWTITVTNNGPYPAPSTRVNLRLPDGMYFAGASTPALFATEPQAGVLLGNLLPGQWKSVSVEAIPQTASLSAELVVSTRSATFDPLQSNNVARLIQPIEASQVPNRVDFYALPATDALFDSVSQMLYLACPALSATVSNTLIVLDPARGTIQRQIVLPGSPGKLAVSSGGEFLYVSLNAADQILRLTLPALETNLLFTTLRDDVPLPRPLCDIAVIPGSPQSIVFSRFGGGAPSPAGVWIYDDDQPRPASFPGGYGGVTFVDFTSSPSTFIAVDYSTARFRRMSIDANGITAQPVLGDASPAVDFTGVGNNLLVGDQLFNRSTFLSKTTFAVPFEYDASALSATGDRAVFVAGSNRAQDPIDFAGFRADTFASIGTARARGLPVQMQKLVLWGTDGVAALGDGYLFLGRLSLAATPTQDSDGDLMPNDWELANGLNPTISDATADLDSDGASNLAEYLAGTDPQSSTSTPSIRISKLANNQLRLVFPCASNRHFYIERNSTLDNATWTPLFDAISTGGMQIYDATLTPTPAARYFRVRITP